MGNGLDTLSYSSSEMDKLIVKMDDNIEWVNNPEFQETRKILNLIKNKLSEGGSVTDEYNDWSKYLLSSIKNPIVNNRDNNELDNDFIMKFLQYLNLPNVETLKPDWYLIIK